MHMMSVRISIYIWSSFAITELINQLYCIFIFIYIYVIGFSFIASTPASLWI